MHICSLLLAGAQQFQETRQKTTGDKLLYKGMNRICVEWRTTLFLVTALRKFKCYTSFSNAEDTGRCPLNVNDWARITFILSSTSVETITCSKSLEKKRDAMFFILRVREQNQYWFDYASCWLHMLFNLTQAT